MPVREAQELLESGPKRPGVGVEQQDPGRGGHRHPGVGAGAEAAVVRVGHQGDPGEALPHQVRAAVL